MIGNCSSPTQEWFLNSFVWISQKSHRKERYIFKKFHTSRSSFVIMLKYIALRESQQSLSYNIWVSRMTISNIVTETLEDPFLQTPSSEEDWKSISERFEEVWSFSDAVRAMDGKHIRIEYPKWKVVSATFLLVCFVWLKESAFRQEKMFFVSLRKLFSFLR